MKNHYEILGVAPHVGSGQIQAAYRFARSLYSGDTTPTHGFLDAEERARMLALVEDAYAALSNPNVRRDYDARLAIPGSRPPHTFVAKPERRPAIPSSLASGPSMNAPTPEEGLEILAVPDVVKGAELKALRERRKLSIDQIAALSKVGGRFLQALEDDRHAALPGRVFARGFLIEYARAIRVPEGELVDRYLKHWTAK